MTPWGDFVTWKIDVFITILYYNFILQFYVLFDCFIYAINYFSLLTDLFLEQWNSGQKMIIYEKTAGVLNYRNYTGEIA